jgi:uncharacterized membrane protein YhaH (DUF805 family)
MKGTVLGFDPAADAGAISGFDGRRYEFATADWHARSRPRSGDTVDFVLDGERATRIYLVAPEYIEPCFGAFYFSPTGRISRSQYWLQAILPMWGIFAVGWIVIWATATAGGHAAAGLLGILLMIYTLAIIWPLIAAHVKRIHDRNKSGSWILIPLVPAAVNVVIWLIALPAAATSAIGGGVPIFAGILIGASLYSVVLCIVQFAISVWFFIEFGCLRGTIGSNRFGPDPVR